MDEGRPGDQSLLEEDGGVTPVEPEELPETEPTEEQPVPAPERQRNLWGLLLLVLIIILVIIIVFLLRQCGGAQGESTRSGDKQIESLAPVMDPVPGTVSVWIDDSTTIERVLAGAGVSPRVITDMQHGRYVVELAAGAPQAAVRRIAQQAGVNDAGLVYEPAEAP